MGCVAITGISGYIGSRLLARLADVESIEKIIGIDIKPPAVSSPKLGFYQRSILEPLDDIFLENGVDGAIHLAFVLRPARDRKGTHRTDVSGTANFLESWPPGWGQAYRLPEQPYCLRGSSG